MSCQSGGVWDLNNIEVVENKMETIGIVGIYRDHRVWDLGFTV